MANRNTLHKKHLNELTAWLLLNGWKIEKPKGYYEVLRASTQGRAPLIVYQRLDMTQHYTVRDKDLSVIRCFLVTERK